MSKKNVLALIFLFICLITKSDSQLSSDSIDHESTRAFFSKLNNSNEFINIGCILLRECPGLFDAYQIATLGISKELGNYLRTITCGFAGREVKFIKKNLFG